MSAVVDAPRDGLPPAVRPAESRLLRRRKGPQTEHRLRFILKRGKRQRDRGHPCNIEECCKSCCWANGAVENGPVLFHCV